VAVYEYSCDECGLQFEEMKPMSKSDEPEVCPECGETARKLVSAVNHTFAHIPVGGPRPQNTGVHSIDYKADTVIGRDAEAKWKLISERQKHKKGIIQSTPGASGHDLSRTHEGDYRVMAPEERRAAETARKVHRTAISAIEASKKSSSGKGEA
jgi:putative FmdB family regulatory protein